MKTKFIAILTALASTAAFGELSWAAVKTAAYESDTSPSAATTAYSAYLCLASTAETTFGSKDVGTVTDYFVNNFAGGKSTLATVGTALDTIDWGSGQYGFSKTTVLPTTVVSDAAEYLGIVLYSSGGEDAVRVFSATADGVTWLASDSASRPAGTAGTWTRAVPEPTSGLLLLLGFASLALRRKRV